MEIWEYLKYEPFFCMKDIKKQRHQCEALTKGHSIYGITF